MGSPGSKGMVTEVEAWVEFYANDTGNNAPWVILLDDYLSLSDQTHIMDEKLKVRCVKVPSHEEGNPPQFVHPQSWAP